MLGVLRWKTSTSELGTSLFNAVVTVTMDSYWPLSVMAILAAILMDIYSRPPYFQCCPLLLSDFIYPGAAQMAVSRELRRGRRSNLTSRCLIPSV